MECNSNRKSGAVFFLDTFKTLIFIFKSEASYSLKENAIHISLKRESKLENQARKRFLLFRKTKRIIIFVPLALLSLY